MKIFRNLSMFLVVLVFGSSVLILPAFSDLDQRFWGMQCMDVPLANRDGTCGLNEDCIKTPAGIVIPGFSNIWFHFSLVSYDACTTTPPDPLGDLFCDETAAQSQICCYGYFYDTDNCWGEPIAPPEPGYTNACSSGTMINP